MRLRPERVLLLALLCSTGAIAAESATTQPGAAQTPAVQPAATQPATTLRLEDIERAMQALDADPNLGIERNVRMLRWISDGEPGPRERPGWARWLAGLFGWLASSARLLVWIACGLLVAMVAVLLVRLVRARGRDRAPGGAAAPTHVRDLDIRPESLPEDIGAAARQLWDAGEPRRALALLYRGLLSKLAHDHRAPVRESTTEGDCVALARRCLPEEASGYAMRLVNTWSSAVYGGLMPCTVEVHALCDGFGTALTVPVAAEPA